MRRCDQLKSQFKKVYCKKCGKEISDFEEAKTVSNFDLKDILDAPKLCYKCMSDFIKNK